MFKHRIAGLKNLDNELKFSFHPPISTMEDLIMTKRVTQQTLQEIIENYEYLLAVGAFTEEEVPFSVYLEDETHNQIEFM